MTASADAARAEAQRARLSAFHHGACCSERTPQLSSRYALPGTWSERTIPMVRKTVRCSTGVTRSFLSQSSELPRRPVMMPAGRNFPEPPGSAGDEPPPAGTALAPPAGVASWRPLGERDSRVFVAEMGTDVKNIVADTGTKILVVQVLLEPLRACARGRSTHSARRLLGGKADMAGSCRPTRFMSTRYKIEEAAKLQKTSSSANRATARLHVIDQQCSGLPLGPRHWQADVSL
jgi:hypothetical protein